MVNSKGKKGWSSIKAFVSKLENWRRKISMGNFAVLETVSQVTEECDGATKILITERLAALELEKHLGY